MQITVIGTSESEDKLALKQAFEVGVLLAKKEVTLVSGGLTGVMNEVSRGAFTNGGDVIAVLPTTDPSDANPFVTHVVATGISHARNLAVVASGDAVIAIGGSYGTLSEIAFALRLGLTVVALGDWAISFPNGQHADLLIAKDPGEAVDLAIKHAIKRERSIERAEAVDDKLDQRWL
jgi:uncharacterized protein (TIGR00725 family)